jgi:hypothetical protein
LEEAYVEHSKSDKYLETGEQTEVVRNYFWWCWGCKPAD